MTQRKNIGYVAVGTCVSGIFCEDVSSSSTAVSGRLDFGDKVSDGLNIVCRDLRATKT